MTDTEKMYSRLGKLVDTVSLRQNYTINKESIKALCNHGNTVFDCARGTRKSPLLSFVLIHDSFSESLTVCKMEFID